MTLKKLSFALLLFCASQIALGQNSAQTPLPNQSVSVNSKQTPASQDELEKVRDQLIKTREELAELKPIASVTNTVFYFVAGLSALLGFFGWRKFSDLDTLVGEQVKLQLPRDKREFAEFEELTKQAEELTQKLKNITADYEAALTNLKYIDIYKDDFDIEGKLRLLIDESTRRRENYVENPSDEVAGSLYDPVWRNSAIALLSKLPQIIERRNLDGDFLFNAAQLCRRMEQLEIARQVTTAAFEKSPSASNKALMLSSTVKAESGESADKALQDLFEMVVMLPRDQPHIVMAEAWNAAVDQAAYQRLADSIEALIKRHESEQDVFLPSYAHAMRALCLLSESRPGCIQEAEKSMARAKETLKHETLRASWVESTLIELSKCERAIAKTRLLHMQLDDKGGTTAQSVGENIAPEELLRVFQTLRQSHLFNQNDNTG